MDGLIRIIVGLHLPPFVSSSLLYMAGINLSASEEHSAYKFVVHCMYMDSIVEVQDALADVDCKLSVDPDE